MTSHVESALRDRTLRFAGLCGLLGLVVCAIGAAVDLHRAAVAYLVAYVAVTTVVLGALALVMIAQLTAATWFVVLRRTAEAALAALPALAVLAVPLLAMVRVLYPWAPLDTATEQVRHAVEAKRAYLNEPFFVIRTVIYWASWLVLGELLRRASLDEDGAEAIVANRRLRVVSAVGVVVFALTVTFASIDWLMSLTPTWSSTVYGVYVYAGGQVGALALLAILAHSRRRTMGEVVNEHHVNALAKLLLTFVLFWVYIGYAQLIVVWSGDVPAEAAWYVARYHGFPAAAGLLLVFGHFVLPFVVLLLSSVRRSGFVLAILGGWLLLMHWLDCYWLVVPSVAPSAVPPWWLQLGALLFVGGAAILCALWRAAGIPAVPRSDARLQASLHYAGR